jgi:hypothetical protein
MLYAKEVRAPGRADRFFVKEGLVHESPLARIRAFLCSSFLDSFSSRDAAFVVQMP